MFDLPYITQPHQIVLAMVMKAFRANSIARGVNPLVLSKLYKVALDSLKEPVNDRTVMASVLRGDLGTLSTATDIETGIYVQLAQVPGNPSLILTVGRKMAMEGSNKTLGSYSTTYW